MRSKRSRLPAIILVAAILVTAAYSVISSIAKKPTVTEGRFPFSITYECNGETVTIKDVYTARYIGNDGYADTKTRMYVGQAGDKEDGGVVYTLQKDADTRIELLTNFYADYLMGDPQYDYFDEEAFKPEIYYYDAEEQEYSDEETLSAHGVKLVSFEYPTPIENSFVFSHISYFSSAIVLPTLLIALLALAAVIVFVKREEGSQRKAVDIVSVILNVAICFVFIPFVSVAAMLADLNGGGPGFDHQVLYFLPWFSVMCIAASVTLRRKGHGVGSLIAQLAGPAVFVVFLIVCGVCEEL